MTLSIHCAGTEAEITVRDTGSGIEPALLTKVFEPFVQGDRTLARTEGRLGLGLAVVKAVAELHGGAVRVESEGAGRGSTFVVHLPLAFSGPRERRTAISADGAIRARRVLVVDDNRDAAESLADIARSEPSPGSPIPPGDGLLRAVEPTPSASAAASEGPLRCANAQVVLEDDGGGREGSTSRSGCEEGRTVRADRGGRPPGRPLGPWPAARRNPTRAKG